MNEEKIFLTSFALADFFQSAFLASTTSFLAAPLEVCVRTYSEIGFNSILGMNTVGFLTGAVVFFTGCLKAVVVVALPAYDVVLVLLFVLAVDALAAVEVVAVAVDAVAAVLAVLAVEVSFEEAVLFDVVSLVVAVAAVFVAGCTVAVVFPAKPVDVVLVATAFVAVVLVVAAVEFYAGLTVAVAYCYVFAHTNYRSRVYLVDVLAFLFLRSILILNVPV